MKFQKGVAGRFPRLDMGNTIYNENYLLSEVLRMSEILKTEFDKENEALKNASPEEKLEQKKRIQQIFRIRNNAFCMLLRNGFSCIRNGKNELIMDINGQKFICKEDAIKTIFQKDYEKIISQCLENKDISMEVENNNEESVKQEVSSEEKKVESENKTEENKLDEVKTPVSQNKTPEEITDVDVDIKVTSSNEIKEPVTAADNEEKVEYENREDEKTPETVTENKEAESKTDIQTVREQVRENVRQEPKKEETQKVRLIYPVEDDVQKNVNEQIVDIYRITMLVPGKEKEQETENVEIRVIPLSAPKNGTELSTDVLAYIKTNSGTGCYASRGIGRKSVNVDTDKYHFLVRGSWDNGVFKTNVYTTGDTLADKLELNRKVNEIRPNNVSDAKLGHPVIYIRNKDNEDDFLRVHAVPLKRRNDQSGFVESIFFTEGSDGKTSYYRTEEKGYVVLQLHEQIYKLYGIWDKETYITTCEHLM